MNYSMKSRIVAALLVGLSATTIGYAEEPAISTVNPFAIETTDETNEAAQDATIGQGGGEASGEADSLAYLDNAPIKQRLKMSALKQGGWRNKWQLLNLVTLYSSGKRLAKMKGRCRALLKII